MGLSTAGTFLFVFYCIEVGVFFLLAPWNSTWDRAIIGLPFPMLHDFYMAPLFRGALSGFGLIHIVWGVHDLDRWLAQRQSRKALRSGPVSQHPVAGSPGSGNQNAASHGDQT